MLRFLRPVVLGWWIAALAAPAFADRAPEWLTKTAAATLPADASKADAVTLLDEQIVSVQGGTATLARRRVVRVLSAEGKDAAIALVRYDTSSAKVGDLHAWLLRPGGDVKELGSDAAVDVALVNGDVYNEARVRSVVASGEIEVGGTFGWEVRVEDRSVLREYEWAFQDQRPTLCSRFTLDVPRDWTVKSATFGRAPIDPVVSGTTRTWELRNLPAIPPEPLRPPLTALVPRLAVSAIAPSRRADAVAFEQWDSLGAWLGDLASAPGAPNEIVAAKAREVTRGCTTHRTKARAIARFVQGVPYASIQMGTGRGGGYRPRAAAEVLTRWYGDCKDKSNLMCVMLRSVGIAAYPLAVYSSDRDYVRDGWPAAQQFNHCIVALAAGDAQGPVVTHPRLGRLLVFDPTDESTPLGELPVEEQGSLGILMVREAGALIRLPLLPPERNRTERSNEVTLAADGSVRGTMRERSWGSVGRTERALYRSLASTAYRERIQTWLASTAPRAVVNGFKADALDSTDAFALDFEYAAERYAQSTAGLLLLRPTFVERWDESPTSDAARKAPVDIEERTSLETTRIRLPEGISVDEAPDPVHLTTSFGSYDWEIDRSAGPGELRVHREIRMHRTTLPPDQYPAVRAFYERVRAAEQAPVVLTRAARE